MNRNHRCRYILPFVAAMTTLSAITADAAGFSQIYSFTPELASPSSPLTQGKDGALYGIAGAGNRMVYRCTTSGVLSLVCRFDGFDGRSLTPSLDMASDGNFYGAFPGSSSLSGVIEELTPSGALTTLQTFTGSLGGTPYRTGSVRTSDGSYYGITSTPGSTQQSIYKITAGGLYSIAHTFAESEGTGSSTRMTLGSDGNLYGMVAGFFRLTPAGTFTMLHMLNTLTDGVGTDSPMIEGADGNFYGTCSDSGPGNHGTVFQVSKSGAYKVLHRHRWSNSNGRSSAGQRWETVRYDLRGRRIVEWHDL